MTTPYTLQSQPPSFTKAVFLKGFNGILRTGRKISATRWSQRGNILLIPSDQRNKKSQNPIFHSTCGLWAQGTFSSNRNQSESLDVAALNKEACMSLYHFDRLVQTTFYPGRLPTPAAAQRVLGTANGPRSELITRSFLPILKLNPEFR